MSTTFDIHHVTTSQYGAMMRFARCNVRLRPIAWEGQTLISHSMSTDPGGTFSGAASRGGLCNLDRLLVATPTKSLTITSDAIIKIDRMVPVLRNDDLTITQVAAMARTSHDVGDAAPAPFLYPSPRIAADAAIADWAKQTLSLDRPALEAGLELAKRITREFKFDPDATKTETLPREAFDARAGVCQDFAQIMIGALRSVGLPAAYASGYIRTIPPAGQERLQGADAMHGWVLLWCGPDRGWIGLDPTNAILMAGDHIVVAIGRDYQDIAPIDGIFTGSGAQNVRVAVDVVPVG
jgi:transglutaminase-like putative cysteine protease